MNLYTYNAPPYEYTICTQLCLKSMEKGATIAEARKVWGRHAPIVKCRGELFYMAHDDFKRMSGHYAGKQIGEPEDYYL